MPPGLPLSPHYTPAENFPFFAASDSFPDGGARFKKGWIVIASNASTYSNLREGIAGSGPGVTGWIMPFADKALKCKDCNEDFIFTSKQQEHHAKLGLRNEPKRCMICRQVARMRNDDRRGGPRPPRRFGPPGEGGPPRPGAPGGFREGPREVFMATCAACGKQTDLPFKPRGDRPVYCRDCFRKQR